jgi:hypothetical protein
MLMLTHAWLLENYLGVDCFEDKLKDLYVYNICPDFLPIRKEFTSEMTHGVSRFRNLPNKHRRAAFIHFHLMVDDIAHHGLIDKIPVKTFNPYSKGYTYLKGKSLVEPLMELYREHGQPIDLSVSAYRAHMIIEMVFDLTLYLAMKEESDRLIELMCEGMQCMTQRKKSDEFSATVGWLYNADPRDVAEALHQCAQVYTRKRMNSFMSLEGRIHVFMNKFGLEASKGKSFLAIEKIMTQGMDLIGDYRDFLDPTLGAIRKAGFNPVF